MDELLVDPTEAGRRLHLSRSVIYELLGKGDLASIKIGKSRRIAVTEIERYVERLYRRQREAVADAR